MTVDVGPVPFLLLVEHTVPAAEPCEAGCGARVGTSDLSGEDVRWRLPEPLSQMTLPVGLWEEPHSALSDDGKPVHAVVFHDVTRCRELRGLS